MLAWCLGLLAAAFRLPPPPPNPQLPEPAWGYRSPFPQPALRAACLVRGTAPVRISPSCEIMAAPPPRDDPASAGVVNTLMFALGHLARAAPGLFDAPHDVSAPAYQRVSSLFDAAPVDASWAPSLRRAALRFGVRRAVGDGDGGGGDGCVDNSNHVNEESSRMSSRPAHASDALMLASAADISSSRVRSLARPGRLLREGLLCEEGDCNSIAGVVCTGACCRSTGRLLCYAHDVSKHALSVSDKRCVLTRVCCEDASAGSSSLPPVVIRSLCIDEFVQLGVGAPSLNNFVDESAIVRLPLAAPEAAECPACGSSLSSPLSWDCDAPFKSIGIGQSFSVGHVKTWRCAAKSRAGYCGKVWSVPSSGTELVGATALTPDRTHAIIADGVGDAHLRQRVAASHGQPAEELSRVLDTMLPLASLRRWLWATTSWEVHVWALLLGAIHACIVCGSSPRAVFVDGCFSASRRATAGGWSAGGWSVGTTALDDPQARLDEFDSVAHAGGAAGDALGDCGEWTAGAEIAGAFGGVRSRSRYGEVCVLRLVAHAFIRPLPTPPPLIFLRALRRL